MNIWISPGDQVWPSHQILACCGSPLRCPQRQHSQRLLYECKMFSSDSITTSTSTSLYFVWSSLHRSSPSRTALISFGGGWDRLEDDTNCDVEISNALGANSTQGELGHSGSSVEDWSRELLVPPPPAKNELRTGLSHDRRLTNTRQICSGGRTSTLTYRARGTSTILLEWRLFGVRN